MLALVTGSDILTHVGVKVPTPEQTLWAQTVADAVNAGIETYLNGAAALPPIGPLMAAELKFAALTAGAEGFKRQEAVFGLTGYADMEGNAIRVARDYLEGVKPLLQRYTLGPGIG